MTARPPQVKGIPAEMLAAPLLLLVPLWGYLHFHGFGALRPEAFAIASGLGLIGAAVGWWIHRLHSPLARCVVTAFLVLVSLDLFTDIAGLHSEVLILALGATWLLRTHVHRIAVATLVAVAVSTFTIGAHEPAAVRWDRPAAVTGTRPPLVHLIADEHIGIAGIPADLPGGRTLREELAAYYVQHGFRLFTRAYSQYYLTADVIPNAFNFTARPLGYGWLGGAAATFPAPLRQNRYFERLQQAGFAIRSYAPGFIDYCASAAAPPAFCYRVPANSLFNFPALGMRWSSGTRFVALRWLADTSSLYRRLWAIYANRLRPGLGALGVAAPEWVWNDHHLGPASGMALLGRMRSDLVALPDLRGTAFFGHLLLPHAPYFLARDCAVSPGYTGLDHRAPHPPPRTPELRRAAYALYFPQVGCLTRQIGGLLDELDARGATDAVVIIQGDHGSRIGGPLPPLDQPLTGEDVTDFYSTLFAVRAPGITPGVDTSVVAIKDLLDRFSQAGFDSLPPRAETAPFIYRVGSELSSLRVVLPLPASWPRDSLQPARSRKVGLREGRP